MRYASKFNLKIYFTNDKNYNVGIILIFSYRKGMIFLNDLNDFKILKFNAQEFSLLLHDLSLAKN